MPPTDPAPPRERFLLTLEALPSDVPSSNRLRRLLKYALRGLGLKCVRLVGDPTGTPTITQDASANDEATDAPSSSTRSA